MNRAPLDVHCEIDDGFALCGGNKVPRVPHDRFVDLGNVLANSPPSRRYPWQRCPTCVALIANPELDSMNTSPKMATAGLLRLKKRVARIQKLIDLEAPVSVLVRECRLIAEAGRMIDPAAYFECERDEWVREQRFKISLCAHDNCDEEVATPIHLLDHPSFEHTHCASHANEMLLDGDEEADASEPEEG